MLCVHMYMCVCVRVCVCRASNNFLSTILRYLTFTSSFQPYELDLFSQISNSYPVECIGSIHVEVVMYIRGLDCPY